MNPLRNLKTTPTNQFYYVNTYVCLFLIILCFGCKDEKDKSTTINSKQEKITTTLIKDSKFSFIDSIRVTNSNLPSRIYPIRNSNEIILTEEKFNLLKLEQIFDVFNNNNEYKLFYNANISDNFKTLAIGIYDKESYSSIQLVTYNSNYDIIDSILVYENDYNRKGYTIITNLYQGKLYKENVTLPNSVDYSQVEYYLDNVEEYYIDSQGKFKKSNRPVTFRHYKYRDGFGGSVHNMPKLNVSAKNGLIIRDSLGKRIGKLDFGETVYIVRNTKDTITLKDEGKTITGSKIKIVINKDSVKTGEDFYIDKSNVGFVFSGFLYNHDSFHNDIDEFHYSYDHLALGKDYNEANINLREMFDIKLVNLKEYKNKIIINSKFTSPSVPIKNGDTINQFNGYPHISPNKSYSVSVFPDWIECNQQTSLVINILKDNKYINYATIYVNSWSYPLKLNSEGIPIDDFSIYWLSDNEFIIKVKNPEECYLGKVIEPFYLKYKIK